MDVINTIKKGSAIKYFLVLFFPIIIFGDSLESAFKNSDITGNLTYFYYTIDKEDNTKDAYANALGGDLKLTTDSSNPIFATVGFHNSTPIVDHKNKKLTSLFNNDKDGNALTAVSESFLAYKTKDSIFKVGNFLLNTPLMNKSSARIVPWSYQGASFVINNIFKSSIQLNYINKMRKYTSDQYKDESLAGKIGDGITMIGFKHHPIEPLDVHIYYYNAPSLYDSYFFQIDYKDNFINNDLLFCVGLQNMKTYDHMDVDLIGLRTGIFTEHLDITLNYTKNDGVDKADGYGGLSKIYTASMISNGRGENKPEVFMLKTNFEFELISKHSSEFSVWLAKIDSKLTKYKSYYTHFRHNTDNFIKIYLRYEFQDYEDKTKDAQYLRFITSIDF
ncbi:OprD family outer membrane porin [Sulfurimonas sp.]|uniref:OprD family outer membrane porin n=1 Tax=Sulfurimonas sp. TaxID=2022749 RepID=UPI003564FFCF